MNTDGVDQRVRAYIQMRLNWPDLPDEEDIFESGLVNSLFAMELVHFVERDFGIVVDNDDLTPENFLSVAALSGFVERKLRASGPGDEPVAVRRERE